MARATVAETGSETTRAGDRGLGARVLVTGAGGFIGSHVVEAVATRGTAVRAFVRYNSRNDYGWLESLPSWLLADVEIFRGDLVNPEAVARAAADCDTVLHLGALIPIPYSYVHPREFVTTNVTGTLNVLEAARRAGVGRVVHVSTSEVYGTPVALPIDEQHPIQAQSPYAATKVAADQLVLSFWCSFDTPVAVARPFNTFGPRQSARAVIPTIVTQALARDVVELGATAPARDFVFVEDTAEGIVRCGEAGGVEGEVVNLGTGVETSVGTLARRVLELVGRDVPIVVASDRVRPAASELPRLLSDPRKAHALLGWRHRVDLDEGLRRTVEWVESSLAAYKPAIYNV